jgi:AsmA protein
MPQVDPTYQQPGASESRRARRLPGVLFAVLALFLLLMMALLPPLVSLNHFQHSIAESISGSLGRPVHLDDVNLNLLPLPGFTLTNFVVDEDPVFGSEPIIRANSVRATLRISSLWRRRIEVSTISFTDPSVNLVHLSNGKWNIESILLHAAHIEAAPTAQKRAGPTPRFPYIEATGARLNLKFDQEKTPYSLTDADFSLWLPDPQEWHLRLKGTPIRTDANVPQAGTVQMEGTLGRAASLGEVPLNLRGTWSEAPLGQSSYLLLGRDAGLRGNLALTATIKGTVSKSAIQARLQLIDVRRSEFIPDQLLQVDLECLSTATEDFHAFRDIRCTWPPAGSSSEPLIALTADVPDIRMPRSASLTLGSPGIASSRLLNWLRIASSRLPDDLKATGILSGSLQWQPVSPSPTHWSGDVLLAGAGLFDSASGPTSLIASDISLHSIDDTMLLPSQSKASRTKKSAKQNPSSPTSGFLLAPTALALGGKEPAMLQGHFDEVGYTLHLTGTATSARLLSLGSAIPQFGDGLSAALATTHNSGPFKVDLTATRPWGGEQTWRESTVVPVAAHPRHTHRR